MGQGFENQFSLTGGWEGGGGGMGEGRGTAMHPLGKSPPCNSGRCAGEHGPKWRSFRTWHSGW